METVLPPRPAPTPATPSGIRFAPAALCLLVAALLLAPPDPAHALVSWVASVTPTPSGGSKAVPVHAPPPDYTIGLGVAGERPPAAIPRRRPPSLSVRAQRRTSEASPGVPSPAAVSCVCGVVQCCASPCPVATEPHGCPKETPLFYAKDGP